MFLTSFRPLFESVEYFPFDLVLSSFFFFHTFTGLQMETQDRIHVLTTKFVKMGLFIESKLCSFFPWVVRLKVWTKK